VARLLYGYDVRGGLYFDRSGEGGREEGEGGEGLGGGRDEARNQALSFSSSSSSSSSSRPDGGRGRAEASVPLQQGNAVVGREEEGGGLVPFRPEAQRGGLAMLPPQKEQSGERQGIVEGVQPLLVNGHEASIA
jgi:hypothetical protein